MREVVKKHSKIRISPIFILLVVLSAFFGYLKCAVFSVIFSLLHEMAHLLCAKSYGYELNEIKLMPYGAMLSTGEQFKKSEGVRIALAGPLFSLILALTTVALWWLFPPLYAFTEDIFLINLLLCLFNLLPVFPLDGSRIIMSLFGGKGTIKFLRISGIAFSILFLFIFMISAFCVEFKINYSYAVISILLLSSVILEPKKIAMRRITDTLATSKKLNSGVKLERLMIAYEANLYKVLRLLDATKMVELAIVDEKMCVISVVNEEKINEWLTSYPLTTKLKDIVIAC